MADTQMYDFKVKSIIHDYEVHFIDNLKQSIDSVLKAGDYIIIDNIVKDLYDEYLRDTLDTHKFIGIDANEVTKSYQGVESVIEALIQNGFRKNHRLVAIGGGITQDVTAFISSIMYRGVNWIYYPTTLLAQGDSCIGSKTSINFGHFKNQVGGFYPANYIYIYPPFKETLTEKEIRSGMGEMLHYFIVSGKEDFDFYRKIYKSAFTDKVALTRIINKSLEIKKRYIEIDEFDKKERQVFNYGHTFGHAIESLTEYRIPHGIAVSYGMDMSNYISVKMGLIQSEVREEIREVTSFIWEGYPIGDIDIHTYINVLSKDKKNVGNQLGLILNNGYGKIFKNLTDADKTFQGWIEEYFSKEIK